MLIEAALQILPIERSYYDIWGREQAVSEESVRGILRALRFDIDNEQRCLDQLNLFRISQEREVVKPVYVVRGTTLQLPISFLTPWKITSESGREYLGELSEGGILHLPQELELGYHQLEIEGFSKSRLIRVPDKAYSESILNQRAWGVTAQLYALHSVASEGIGDYVDLRKLAEWTSSLGGAFVGVNPLHALFPGDPLGYSPYSPSSRRALNPLYIRLAEVQGLNIPCPLSCSGKLVDYSTVTMEKLALLRRAFEQLFNNSERLAEFEQFERELDIHTHRFALHSALQTHLGGGWMASWPEKYRQVAQISSLPSEIDFERRYQLFLQWLARDQLLDASADLELGLYLDLAVGVNPNGAEVWEDPDLFAPLASAGAPPDLLNVLGQVWGLAPYIPWELERRGYEPFVQTLRFNMQFAGALRIDHIMALQRTFWVPEGMDGQQGVYLRYPLDDLLGIVCLESVRNQCVVIGEDLGTVPNEIRAAMKEREILSYKVLFFMKHHEGDGSFLAPAEYETQALVTASTHDLPTIEGFVSSEDLKVRKPLGLFSENCTYEGESAARRDDISRLKIALEQAGFPEIVASYVHQFLATTPCSLQALQLEDLVGELDQMNLPGTVTEHPNWRRRVKESLESIFSSEEYRKQLELVNAARRS